MKVVNHVLHALMKSPLLLIAFFPAAIWPFPVCAFWFAFWREDATHRIGKKEGWKWIWGGWGRWWDIFWGTIGGLAFGLIAHFVLR